MRTTKMGLVLTILVALFSLTANVSAAKQINLNQNFYPNGKSPTLLNKTIVVDPGHGGSDTGAIGPNGVKEKDITLAISKELKPLLEKGGAKVILTRSKDQDVYDLFASPEQELQARTDIANKAGADLFISVHVDACDDKTVGGTTTYYFDKTDGDNQLARSVENSLNFQLHLSDRGNRDEDLYVLKNTTMPAVLTEVAYISNPSEEKLVQLSSFRKKAALGMYNGIKNYFASTT
jgi:N-acetylmuramoyl-L-alanine amidase